jgi:hypothetical protein
MPALTLDVQIGFRQPNEPQELAIQLIKLLQGVEGRDSTHFPNDPRQISGVYSRGTLGQGK